MMIDSNGIPVTRNDAGYDGGDGLANYSRYALVRILNEVPKPDFSNIGVFEYRNGILVRHPGTGNDPDGNPWKNVPYFWASPAQLSRDNSRALFWLIHTEELKKQMPAFVSRVLTSYKQRGSLTAQNGDIMLPLQGATIGPLLWLRDLELLFNTAVQTGLFPIFKHDKPWGFGKGKRITFTWLDSDEVDGDANLTADYAGTILVKSTWISKTCLAWYRLVRGAKGVRHYYRAESGNNPQIAEEYVKALRLK